MRFGARDCDPLIGRWATKDPIGFGAADTNLYGYALNDPINEFDPNGQFSLSEGVATTGIIALLARLANLHFNGTQHENDCVQDFAGCMANCYIAPGVTTWVMATGEAGGFWATATAWAHAASKSLTYPLKSSVVRWYLDIGAEVAPVAAVGSFVGCEAKCLTEEVQCVRPT